MTGRKIARLLVLAAITSASCSEWTRHEPRPEPERQFEAVTIRDVTSADVLFVIDDS